MACSRVDFTFTLIADFGGTTRRKVTTLKTRLRWEDNTKVDLTEIKLNVMVWIYLAEDRYEW